MSQPITLEQLAQIPPRKYKIIRSELKTGDLIFCSGNSLFNKIIQKFTKSNWSHVGIIYKDEILDRVLVLESDHIYGVRLSPLSKYLRDYHGKNKPYKGKIVAARLHPEISVNRWQKAISFGMDALTKPYNYVELIHITIRTLFKMSRHKNNKNYICSEFVQECFKQADINLKDIDTTISPEEIWNNNQIEFLYRLL